MLIRNINEFPGQLFALGSVRNVGHSENWLLRHDSCEPQ